MNIIVQDTKKKILVATYSKTQQEAHKCNTRQRRLEDYSQKHYGLKS